MASLFSDHAQDGAAGVDGGLDALEKKLATLLAHVRALRAANEALRRELAAAQARNRALGERVVEAKARIDALVARLPEETE